MIKLVYIIVMLIFQDLLLKRFSIGQRQWNKHRSDAGEIKVPPMQNSQILIKNVGTLWTFCMGGTFISK